MEGRLLGGAHARSAGGSLSSEAGPGSWRRVVKGRVVPERAPVDTPPDVHADHGHGHWLWCRMAGERMLEELPDAECVVLTREHEWQLVIKDEGTTLATFDSSGEITLAAGMGAVDLHYLEQGPFAVADAILHARDVAEDAVTHSDHEAVTPTRLTVTEPSPLQDLGRWCEAIPEKAPTSMCLPAWGGRVVVRGYDTALSSFAPVSTSIRWIIETTMVPLEDRPDVEGPGGVVFPGDCIVFFGTGTSAEEREPELWHPQRVLRVESLAHGWQRVWTLADASVRDEPAYLHHTELPKEIFVGTALQGNWRDFVLDSFQLAIECFECGGYGKPVVYGLVDEESDNPHVIAGGTHANADDPGYQCACGAQWRINADGHRSVKYL